MLNYLILTGSLEAITIALTLSLGNFSIGFPGRTQHSEIKSAVLGLQSPPNPAPDTASTGLADGIYLYGQSSQPDQIKKEYFVFEMRQSKLIGALLASVCFLLFLRHGRSNSVKFNSSG